MSIQPLMSRKIKVETSIRCDFDSRVIEKGKYATQIVGDESVKCQGIYHGKNCYDAALNHFNEAKREIENG